MTAEQGHEKGQATLVYQGNGSLGWDEWDKE